MSRRFLLGALMLFAAPAMAQTRQVRTLNAEGAQNALTAALAEAKKNNWLLSIAVVDPATPWRRYGRGSSPSRMSPPSKGGSRSRSRGSWSVRSG
jgi:hypothetical protein